MKRRVLILSTSAGTGHVRAGDALAAAFAADARVAEVVHEDALRFTNRLFRDCYSKLYTTMVRSAPTLFGWCYRSSDQPWKTDAVRLRLDRLNTAPLIAFVRELDPHIIVCTHFMPAGIISYLIRTGALQAQHSIVVTDFDAHAMWLTRTFHRYFVAIDETRAHLVALGLPPERITVSGIPIDPAFSRPIDRAAALRSYGFEPGKPTLLLSAGALGGGPTALALERLKQIERDIQTVVICGRNETLRTEIEAVVGADPRFRVLGYSDRVFELMKMSDLFIGKPGGLTTAEALASGLPMVILSPIPGQEERNSDHLLEEGAAIKCNDLTTIPYKIEQLLGDRSRLEAMRQRAARLGRPAAARAIVETLLSDDLPPFLPSWDRTSVTSSKLDVQPTLS